MIPVFLVAYAVNGRIYNTQSTSSNEEDISSPYTYTLPYPYQSRTRQTVYSSTTRSSQKQIYDTMIFTFLWVSFLFVTVGNKIQNLNMYVRFLFFLFIYSLSCFHISRCASGVRYDVIMCVFATNTRIKCRYLRFASIKPNYQNVSIERRIILSCRTYSTRRMLTWGLWIWMTGWKANQSIVHV